MGNILWKRARQGVFKAPEVNELLLDMFAMPIEIVGSSIVLPRAVELAVRHDRTVYDCLYLAVAMHTGGKLLTADRRFANALADSPVAEYLQTL